MMQAFETAELIRQQQQGSTRYLEFLRVASLSMGLYVLPAGGQDTQQPHSEDEVYYVVSGAGMIRVGEEDRPVQAGSVVFVAAHVRHYFHNIREALHILVFFAPAEYSQKPGPTP